MKKYKLIVFIFLAPLITEAQDSSLIVTKLVKSWAEVKKKAREEISKIINPTTRDTSTQLELQKDNNYVVTVTKTPLYEEGSKESFARVEIKPCELIPANTKVSFSDLTLFFPPSNMEAQIFPGAAFKFSSVKDGSYSFYNHGSPRNPMDLTTDIFTTTAGKLGNTIRIKQFDYGTLHNHWTNLLRDNIKGNTGAETQLSLVTYETERQIKTDMTDIGKVSVGAKLSIPIPVQIPVNVNADLEVSVKNESIKNTSNMSKRNSVIIRFEQTFYTAHLTPKASPTGDMFSFYQNSKAPSDVVYVSSVDYGMVYYLVITSNASKEVLINAVNNELKVEAGLGVEIPALPAGGELDVEVSNETKKSYERALSSSESSMSIHQWGGSPFTVKSVQAAIDSINVRNKFSAENLGKPIRYTLNFADDYSNGYINVNNSYATADCGKAMSNGVYDVEITCTKIKNVKAKNSIKLSGEVFLKEYVLTRNGKEQKIKSNYNYWKTAPFSKSLVSLSEDEYLRVNKSFKIRNLTFEELTTLKFYLGAKLFGEIRNLGIPIVAFAQCRKCDNESYTRERSIKSNQTEIDILPVNNSTYLKVGDDNILNLDCDFASYHVSADFNIKVTHR
ncbi:MAG: hypothetical protein QM668_07755 [Agriterribacter sp.]